MTYAFCAAMLIAAFIMLSVAAFGDDKVAQNNVDNWSCVNQTWPITQ